MKNRRNWFQVPFVVIGMLIYAFLARASGMAFLHQSPGIMKRILAPTGIFSLAVFGGICLLGLAGWVITFTRSKKTSFVCTPPSIQWTALIAFGLYIAAALLLVQQADFRILITSWFTPVFLTGWIVLYKLLIHPKEERSFPSLRWQDLLLGGTVYLLLQSLLEMKSAIPPSTFWRAAYLILMVVNGFLTAGVAVALKAGPRCKQIFTGFSLFREKNRLWLGLAVGILSIIPIWFLFFRDVTGIGAGLTFRLEILLVISFLLSVVLEPDQTSITSFTSMVLAVSLSGYGMMVAGYFSQVTDYPLGLYWSEGNRFYDYSLIFGKSRYQFSGELNPNYFSPGRYGLWGLPFLIPSLPIAAHRVWNAFLYCVPGTLLGWLLADRAKDSRWRWSVAFGTALFLNQGPIYPSLTLSLVLIAISMRSKPVWRILAVAIASYYAGVSRFTWVLVTGAWAGLVDLYLWYPQRSGNWFRKLLPTLGFILLGVLPGMAFSWPEVIRTQGDTIQSQQLLWYRLFPSSTYPLGVIPALVIATGALFIYLIDALVEKRWKPDPWQLFASAVVLLGFLISGFVASSKIGGGSNLHNMDMFLVSLLLIFILTLLPKTGSLEPAMAPLSWQKWVFLATMLIPAWSAMWGISPLQLPPAQQTRKVIAQVQAAADTAILHGEVLFMDQRQLLTFGEIKNIPLTADYEKKYMMDQAMAGNEPYFKNFYADLASHRFSLIVAETQKVNYQTRKDDFNEENNAWVYWVSEPFLKYYRPIATFKDYGFSLYVPR